MFGRYAMTGTPPKVLIVDTDPVTTMALKQNLVALGMDHVDIARDGIEAERSLHGSVPDIIIIDVDMGGDKHGLSFVERHMGEMPGVSIIFTSVETSGEVVERAKRLSPMGFIPKPFTNRELMASIEIGLFKKDLDDRLRNSERRYRDLFDQAGDAIFIVDGGNGTMIDANMQACLRLGLSREELVGRPMRQIEAPDDHRDAERRISTLLERGNVIYDDTLVDGKGESFPVEISAKVVPSDDGLTFQYIVRDITDRRRNEEEIRRKNAFIMKVIDALDHPFYVIDPADYTLALRNRRSMELYGDGPVTCHEASHGRDRPCSEFGEDCPLEEVVRTRGSVRLEHIHTDLEGRDRYYAIHATPLISPSGEVEQVIEYSIDITERKEAELELKHELSVIQAIASLSDALVSGRATIDELCTLILDISKKLTGSEHGFVSVIDQVTGDNVSYTLTSMMEDCPLPDEQKRITFPRGEDGRYPCLWGAALNMKDTVLSNSPSEHSASHGTPEGHIALERFLSVPAVVGDELLGQIALGNSPREYTSKDAEVIGQVADLFALALQRLRTEDEITRAEKEWERTFENMSDAISIHDPEFRVLKCNRRFREDFGCDPSDGIACHQVVHGIDCAIDSCPLKAAMESGRSQTREVYEASVDRTFSVTCDPIRDEGGEVSRVVHIMRDVTTEKRLREDIEIYAREQESLVEQRTQSLDRRLHESEQLSVLAEQLLRAGTREEVMWEGLRNLGVGYGFQRGSVFLRNEETGRFDLVDTLGTVPLEPSVIEERLGECLEDTASPQTPPGPECHLSEILTEKAPLLVEQGLVRQRGTSRVEGQELIGLPSFLDRTGRYIMAPIILEEGPEALFILQLEGDLLFMDASMVMLGMYVKTITSSLKMVRLIDRLERSYAKLKDVDAMKTEFVDVAAHELRTPLASIKIYTDLMKAGYLGSFSDDQRDKIVEMDRNIGNLNELINEMLEYTRTESKLLSLSIQDEMMNDVIVDVLSSFEQVADARSISLGTSFRGDTWVRMDRPMVAKVITNLVGNAFKYSDEGSAISVRVDGVDPDRIQVEVTDTGIGIREEDLPNIFDRYFMGDTSLTRQRDQLGLGLSIARSIVEKHGGTISAESVQGEGSTFRFTLPRHQRTNCVDEDELDPSGS